MTESQPRSYRTLTDSDPITDPTRVARLLMQLANRYNLITVEIPGHTGHYTSSIVSVNERHVLLDELLPSDGHQVLLRERKLEVIGKLDGIDIQFITTLEHADKQDNVTTYHTLLPVQLNYRQRRHDHRAHIPLAQTLSVIFDGPEGTLIEGTLHDLSRSGAGMLFPDSKPIVEPGLLHECAIELPDSEWLYSTVELRHTNNLPATGRQLIGARFVGLTPIQRRLIGHSVSKLEREFIRKRTAD